MRIGIDAYPLSGQFKGINFNLYNTISVLQRIDRENEYFLYTPPSDSLKLPFYEVANWHLRFTKGRLSKGSTLWMQMQAKKDLLKDNIDVFWSAQAIIPVNLPPKIKSVLTVNDLTHCLYPLMTSWKNRIIFPLFFKRSLSRANKIITISETIATDLKKMFPKVSGKVVPIQLGVSTQEYQPIKKREAKDHISLKFKTSPSYILTVSTVEPRKNTAKLLEAYAIFKKKYPDLDYQLLICGARGWKNNSIYKTYKRLNFSTREVKFLGYVPKEDMSKLYSGAELFIFPSVYEGFGFPALESMACGVPVIASDIPVFREVSGEAAIFADTRNPESLSQAMYKVLIDDNLKVDLIKKGFKRIKLFSWEKTASKVLDQLVGK